MVETLVSLSIISILSMVVFGVVTIADNAVSQGMIRSTQQNKSDLMLDYLKSNLTSVEVGEVGLLAADGNSINPASLAGDQVVIHHGSRCQRLFYVARERQLKVATSSEGCDDIAPVRGPNQVVGEDGYLIADENSPLFDAVLDDPEQLPSTASVFLLADDLALAEGGSTDTTALTLFSYVASDDPDYYPLDVDEQADGESWNATYMDPALLDSIAWLKLHGFVNGRAGVGISVGSRLVAQEYMLNR
jgi:hypothetical protein